MKYLRKFGSVEEMNEAAADSSVGFIGFALDSDNEPVVDTKLITDNVNYMAMIRKTYASYADMVADTNPTADDGTPVFRGQLVSVVNPSDGSRNGIYSRTRDGWEFQSSFNVEIAQTTGTNPNIVMSQQATTESLDSVRALTAYTTCSTSGGTVSKTLSVIG